jgi:hypothetical protein
VQRSRLRPRLGSPRSNEAIDRWGRVNVLVNNAGATAMIPLAEITGPRIAELFALNVTAPSLLARAALPFLREVHGSIVNVSSTFGHRPLPGGSHYAATKSAIEMLTGVGHWNSLRRTCGSTQSPRVPPRVRPLPRRGYLGKRSTRSNRMRQLGFRSDGAANPRTSRPGSSTSRTYLHLAHRTDSHRRRGLELT